ncbi:hypothetical protein ACS0TY_011616 [Phlomoides rotata]
MVSTHRERIEQLESRLDGIKAGHHKFMLQISKKMDKLLRRKKKGRSTSSSTSRSSTLEASADERVNPWAGDGEPEKTLHGESKKNTHHQVGGED